MRKKERLPEIGVLRGLAFAAVVLQHTIAHYSIVPGITLADGVLLSLLLLAAKFAVPVFIFITGLVLFYNDEGTFSYKIFFSKRFKEVVVPYVIWSTLFEIASLFSTAGGWNRDTLLLYGQKLLTGKASYHLWYIAMIIQCYLLFPLLRKVIRRAVSTIPVKLAPVAMIVAGLLYIGLTFCVVPLSRLFAALDIPVLTPLFTVYADRNVLYFLFYFLLGAFAGMNIGLWKEWVRKWGLIYWSLFVLLSGILLFSLVESFQTAAGLVIRFHSLSLLSPLMVAYCTVSIFAAYRTVMAIIATGSNMVPLISWLGTVSYGAYLMHPFILNFTYLSDPRWNVTVRTLISFVLCSLLSAGGAWLLSKLPLGRWMVGYKAQRWTAIPATTGKPFSGQV